jgi:hypothetical protein
LTKDEALKLALEYLEASDNYLGSLDHSEPIAAIKEALAQPAQEAELDELTIAYMSGLLDGKKQRPWVSLTDEEREYWIGCNTTKQALARAIDNALKEKNNGN